ncbi:MAG: DUF362 domain-containing protein [bacterium]
MSKKNIVSIIKVAENLNSSIAKAMLYAECDNVICPGDTVLIKPNLNGCSIKGSTNISVIKAIAQWAYYKGAGRVIIGEGPVQVGKVHLQKYFSEIGIEKAVKEIGAEFVIFDEHDYIIHKGVSKYLPDEIGISKFLYEADKIINVPMLKVHPSTMVTLCMKNLKGCIRERDKKIFHRLDLHRAITELNRLIKPSINLIDGTKAMQGTDHNNGDIVELGLIFCSKDIIAVDAVASYTIGIDPENIRLIRLGNKAGLGESRIEKLQILGENLEENRTRFELPEEAMIRRFPDLRILKNGACSACLANMMDALGWIGDKRKYNTIVLGSDVPSSNDDILIGNCTRKYWSGYEHVRGCPPISKDIAEALSKSSLNGTIYSDK